MAIVTINDQRLQDIAAALRENTGSSAQYTPAQMAQAIGELSAALVKKTGFFSVASGSQAGQPLVPATIATGLSRIQFFILQSPTRSNRGLDYAFYAKDGASFHILNGASSSSEAWNDSGDFIASLEGGTIVVNTRYVSNSSPAPEKEYSWTAYGK